MHLSSFIVYVWLMFDRIIVLFLVISSACILFLTYHLFCLTDECLSEEEWKSHKKKVYKDAIIAVVFFLFALFTPTSQEIALIYLLPKVVNSETTRLVCDKGKKDMILFLEYAKKELERRIDELEKRNNIH